MKVLLNLFFDQTLDWYPKNEYPLGLLSLARYVTTHEKDIEFRVISGALSCDDIAQIKPDLIGFSSLSPFFTKLNSLLDEIKDKFPKLPIIIGGHHITYRPEDLPTTAIAGVLGEGEATFLELCRLFSLRIKPSEDALANIAGIVFRNSFGETIQNASREPIPVEEIPVLDNYEICTFKTNKPIQIHIMTSRGCTYRCRFCSSSPFWKRVRFYDPVLTVDQIEYLVNKFSASGDTFHIHIFDDLMIADKPRLKTIRDLIVNRGIQKKVSFDCWISGNHFDKETAMLLKDIHVVSVCVAIESGSPKVYQYLKGNWSNPELNKKAIRLAFASGFDVSTSVIVGAPPETLEDLEITYTFLKKLPISGGLVHVLKAYPGTVLWKEAEKRGLVNYPMVDWMSIDADDILDSKTKLLSEHVSREDVHRIQQKIKKLLDNKAKRYWKKKLVSLPHLIRKLKKESIKLLQ